MDWDEAKRLTDESEKIIREIRSKGHDIKCRYCPASAMMIYKTDNVFWGLCWQCWDERQSGDEE